MNYLAFDIGGSSIKWAVLTKEATIIERGKISRQDDFESMVMEMMNVYTKCTEIAGIGISAPGSVDPQTGIIGGVSALDYIHGPNFIKVFNEKTSLPVAIENDANCAALSEVYFGKHSNVQNIAYVVMGSGIGGAIIKERKIHHGANRLGGEFGYMLMNGENQNWSDLGSPVNLLKSVRKLINNNSLTGAEVFELAKTNVAVHELVEEFYLVNARGLYNVQYTYDPEIILLGGAITENKEVVSKLKYFVELTTKSAIGQVLPKIEVGKYGQDANLVGALANLLF